MLLPLVFFLALPYVGSLSHQEDLSVSNYFRVGCLTLKPEKRFLLEQRQENSLVPYQAFSSSNMTIELCFRLCRRWIILINQNQTRCICLFTINKPYQFNEHLGRVSLGENCTSTDLDLYSFTKDFYVLPSPSPTHDWSLDGCYYLHGIQTIRANLALTDVGFTQALDICRTHCQTSRNTNYFSFFLSTKKFCYCLPIKLPSGTLPLAVRKPLVHCSFLSYIQAGYDSTLNLSEIHADTVVKIDVQRYCSSTFIFDRHFYLCLKLAPLGTRNDYSLVANNERCSPLLLQTYDQWYYFTTFSFLMLTQTFTWIDRNSTYIFDDLFRGRYDASDARDLCIVMNRTNVSVSTSMDLVPCTMARSPGQVLCAQPPLETIIADQEESPFV